MRVVRHLLPCNLVRAARTQPTLTEGRALDKKQIIVNFLNEHFYDFRNRKTTDAILAELLGIPLEESRRLLALDSFPDATLKAIARKTNAPLQALMSGDRATLADKAVSKRINIDRELTNGLTREDHCFVDTLARFDELAQGRSKMACAMFIRTLCNIFPFVEKNLAHAPQLAGALREAISVKVVETARRCCLSLEDMHEVCRAPMTDELEDLLNRLENHGDCISMPGDTKIH
jgi:hypothetical protein